VDGPAERPALAWRRDRRKQEEACAVGFVKNGI
jgi:hypothetical protein